MLISGVRFLLFGLVNSRLIIDPEDAAISTNPSQLRYPRSSNLEHCGRSCSLPSCFCGKGIPGGLSPDQTPQFVVLSFDDAVNDLNRDFYRRVFNSRVNPDGCPIAATFFVSHEWTDYSQVHELYQGGHEMSSHSVTHSQPSGRGVLGWGQELGGQAQLLSTHGLVEPEDVAGVRAPFLETGGDPMFTAMEQFGFLYDSSFPSRYESSPLWPYTAHQGIRQACNIPPCPAASHPNIWEIPMIMMTDGSGGQCSMLDACRYDETVDSIQRMLTRNFLRHYTDSSKPPFPMAYHAAWFRSRPHREEAFVKFIDSLLEFPDVFFVTGHQLISWISNPVPLSEYINSKHCDNDYRKVKRCQRKTCSYGGRMFVTCSVCPDKYPWI